MTVFLCHLFISYQTMLVVVSDPELCYNYPYASKVHVSLPYDLKKRFDRERLDGICAWGKNCKVWR
jgi:hypothetical protein